MPLLFVDPYGTGDGQRYYSRGHLRPVMDLTFYFMDIKRGEKAQCLNQAYTKLADWNRSKSVLKRHRGHRSIKSCQQ